MPRPIPNTARVLLDEFSRGFTGRRSPPWCAEPLPLSADRRGEPHPLSLRWPACASRSSIIQGSPRTRQPLARKPTPSCSMIRSSTLCPGSLQDMTCLRHASLPAGNFARRLGWRKAGLRTDSLIWSLQEIDVGRLFLEYDSRARAAGFEPLRFLHRMARCPCCAWVTPQSGQARVEGRAQAPANH